MKHKIGGHLFVRDAIKYDYCVIESIKSMIPFCDKVLVMDCSSTDGTVEMLMDEFAAEPKVRLILDQPWNTATGQGGIRLRIIADKCRRMIQDMGYEWQFMLQADEVVHESSYQEILKAVESSRASAYISRRIDMMWNMDLCMWADINKYPANKRPMEPSVCRLGVVSLPVIADASDIDRKNADHSTMEKIILFHYSMVRDRHKILDKIIDMHEWYHGQDPWKNNDSRICDMKSRGEPFDPSSWKTPDLLRPIPVPHPKVAQAWVEQRRHQHNHTVCKQAHEGWFAPEDVTMYNEIITQHIPTAGVAVEVGTWMGKSACSIAESCRRKDIILFCVDHWKGSEEHQDHVPKDLFFQFINSVKASGFLGRPIIPIIMPSIRAADFFMSCGKMVDFVFLDAAHDEQSVRDDIAAWRRVIKPGGWIAGHDYQPDGGHWKGVVNAVDSIYPHAVKRRHNSNIWLANPHA